MRRQTFLIGLIALLLAAPLPALFLLEATQPKGAWADWLLNRTLVGVTLPSQNTPFTARTWFDGSFQLSVTKWVGERFCGRELCIRLYNQVLWSLCRKSYMAAESVVTGTDGRLFEMNYLAHYAGLDLRPNRHELDLLALRLRLLHRQLAARGVPFVVVITPSKAAFYPDSIPTRYQPPATLGRPLEHERLHERLSRDGIPMVDGVALTHLAESRLPLPAFPATGTHWTPVAAGDTAEAILRACELASHQSLARLSLSPPQVTNEPNGFDDDLSRLLNLAVPLRDRYLHASIGRAEGSPRRKGQLTIVGGSFVYQLLSVWEQAEAWEQIRFFYYFGQRETYPTVTSTNVDRRRVDWEGDFCHADAVVLEINEAAFTGEHLEAFFASAQAGLAKDPIIPPPGVTFAPGAWYREESDGLRRWRWSALRTSDLTIERNGSAAAPLLVAGRIISYSLRQTLRLLASDGSELWRTQLEPGRYSAFCLRLPASSAPTSTLRFVSDAEPAPPGKNDTRPLGFALFDLVAEPDVPCSADTALPSPTGGL